MNAKWMTALVVLAAAATLAPSHAQAAGTTQISIGNPAYNGPPPTQATFVVTMELDSNQTSFTNFTPDCTYKYLGITVHVPVAVGPYNPPQPGKGPQTVTCVVNVTHGTSYTFYASMNYKDGNNQPATMNATPVPFSP